MHMSHANPDTPTSFTAKILHLHFPTQLTPQLLIVHTILVLFSLWFLVSCSHMLRSDSLIKRIQLWPWCWSIRGNGGLLLDILISGKLYVYEVVGNMDLDLRERTKLETQVNRNRSQTCVCMCVHARVRVWMGILRVTAIY